MVGSKAKSGWEFFDALRADALEKEDMTELVEKADRLEAAYKNVFSGADAEIVLADLKKRYVDPDINVGFYPDGINTAIAMAERGAETRLVKHLLTIKKPGE